MPLPELIRRAVDRDIEEFCKRRSPGRVREKLRTEYHVRGNSVTICETRPHWRDPKAPWTHYGVAQIRYGDDHRWTLYWRDRDETWHVYDFVDPTPDLRSLVGVVDADPLHIFWG